MAFARGNHIDIEPVHYVYANGWLYGRSSTGRTLDVSAREWWPVAFEVDEVDDPSRWRSAVVHGGFYTLDPAGAAWEREEALKAMHLLGTLMSEPPAEGEAPPTDRILFRIAVQEVSGRAAE